MINKQSVWLSLGAGALSLLLQACATTSSPAVAPLRELPQASIELHRPPLQVRPQFGAAPDFGNLLTRGGTALGKVLQSALGFTGIRYRYGGSSPLTGFDCSGFVGYVFRESAGLQLPRASYQMAGADGPALTRQELEPGDLVFFAQRKRVDHVGIYLGEDRFIHAPRTGGRVRTDELSNRYWQRRFVSGKRVIDPAVAGMTGAAQIASTEVPVSTAAAGGTGPIVPALGGGAR